MSEWQQDAHTHTHTHTPSSQLLGLSISKQCPWGKCNHSRQSQSVWQIFFMLEFTPSIRILRILLAVELALFGAQCRAACSSVNTPELMVPTPVPVTFYSFRFANFRNFLKCFVAVFCLLLLQLAHKLLATCSVVAAGLILPPARITSSALARARGPIMPPVPVSHGTWRVSYGAAAAATLPAWNGTVAIVVSFIACNCISR